MFNEWDRIVKDDGFLVFFGRGASFHRWNYLLNEMGWKFKEEIVWDKRRISNMMGSISRIHETVSVLTRKGKIRESRIPYVEKNEYNFEKIERDLSRIKSAFRNKAFLETLESYINGEKIIYTKRNKQGVTFKGDTKISPVGFTSLKSIKEGIKEQDIISITRSNKNVHPTQKPVRLMERLLFCATDEGEIILDPFVGSGSTGVACVNTKRDFIGMELDEEYFHIAEKRIQEAQSEIRLDV